ncbi:MAG: ATP-binding cassette domain-containing protein [Rhodopirellula sp.]|nr:ATP-binding cassette domain-containing protein [Rhodopirellula sp.]
MITLENVAIEQGEFRLTDVSFSIPAGAYGVLMGATGSGKTTILEAVCGLRPVAGGRILLPAGDVTHLRPSERDLGYVPQDGVLFPSMTVAEHLAFALHLRRWPAAAIRRRVGELAAMLAIEPLLPRRPPGLSGGERQRVALGRALAFRPSVLCLDEPLSALDSGTRQRMYSLLQNVCRQTGVTVLHVTHSRREARRLGDTLLRLHDGKVVRDAATAPRNPQTEA